MLYQPSWPDRWKISFCITDMSKLSIKHVISILFSFGSSLYYIKFTLNKRYTPKIFGWWIAFPLSHSKDHLSFGISFFMFWSSIFIFFYFLLSLFIALFFFLGSICSWDSYESLADFLCRIQVISTISRFPTEAIDFKCYLFYKIKIFSHSTL